MKILTLLISFQIFSVCPEKNILILYSSGGGGHVSMAKSLETTLNTTPEYKVEKLDILGELFLGDYFSKKWDHLFAQGKFKRLRLLGKMTTKAGKFYNVTAKERIRRIIENKKPHLIISVFPVGNFIYQSIAQKLGIPFFIVPVDFSPQEYLTQMGSRKKDSSKYKNLTYFLPVEDNEIMMYFAKKNIRTISSGYAVRPEYEEYALKYREADPVFLGEITKLRRESGLDPQDISIFLMMGAKGFGGQVIRNIVSKIKKNQGELGDYNNLHLFVATGGNEQLQEDLEELNDLERLKIHSLGWMDAKTLISYAAFSNAIITKPGGGSTGEFMLLNKPTIMVLNPVIHETFNARMMERNEWADVVDPMTLHFEESLNSSLKSIFVDRKLPKESPAKYFHQRFLHEVKTVLGDIPAL